MILSAFLLGSTPFDGAMCDAIAATEIPVLSQIADAASAGFSIYQGDYVGAGLSAAGILVPSLSQMKAGRTVARLATRGAKGARATKIAKTVEPILEGAVKDNYGRFISKMPANAKSSASFQLLDDGNYLFQATSAGKVPGSSALYQKWVNPKGETFKMIKTTFGPDGSIIHVKPKY